MKSVRKERTLTERQARLLDSICREYIRTGKPVSSSAIAKKYDLGFSSATIRAEMLALDEAGYLFQPYTSAGRAPTDSAYRFFVNAILEKERTPREDKRVDEEVESAIGRKMKTSYELPHYVSKILADFSSGLGFAGFLDEGFFYKHGFREFMASPEFTERSIVRDFAEVLDMFDESFEKNEEFAELQSLTVYIGKEMPMRRAEHLSFIASPIVFRNKRGIAGIFGQKRMNYEKNINLVREISDILKQF